MFFVLPQIAIKGGLQLGEAGLAVSQSQDHHLPHSKNFKILQSAYSRVSNKHGAALIFAVLDFPMGLS